MIRIHAASAIEAARFARDHALMSSEHARRLTEFLARPEMRAAMGGGGFRPRKIRRDADARRGQVYMHAAGTDEPMVRAYRVVRTSELERIAAAAKQASLYQQLLDLGIEKLELGLPLPWQRERQKGKGRAKR